MKTLLRDDIASWGRIASQLESRLVEPRPGELTEPIVAHRLRYQRLLGRRDDALVAWARDTSRTFVCALALVSRCPVLAAPPIAEWLVAQADPLWRSALQLAVGLTRGDADLVRQVTRAWPALVSWSSPGTREDWPIALDGRPEPGGSGEVVERPSVGNDDVSWFLLHFLERLLATSDPAARQHQGVYYTPRAVARRMVLDVDRLLRDEFGLAAGIADLSSWRQVTSARCPTAALPANGEPASRHVTKESPFLHVLDPAAGSGVFLVEVIEQVARRYNESAPPRNGSRASQAAGTNLDEFLARRLERLRGFECLLPACLAAQLNVAVKLACVGFRFTCQFPLLVQLRDTLAGPPEYVAGAGDDGDLATDSLDPSRRLAPGPFTVVLGNPPFSGVSRSDTPWLDRLMRGRAEEDPAGRGYFAVDGQPLGERKVWLNDDYVKFFRHAQWLVDRAGTGLIAFVSNHGYLDNVTFRGMRQSLLQSFPRITVVDLHGNRKRHEMTDDGAPDHNLFDIAQGTAIGYFRSPPGGDDSAQPSFERHDVRGTKDEKLAWLDACVPNRANSEAEPRGPFYCFSSSSADDADGRPRGIPLTEFMPCHGSVPVTARDHLVVAFSPAELADKLALFADPRRTDEEIRRLLFPRARSARYPAGDTRGWKLDVARRKLASLAEPRTFHRECLYRPWDWRTVFWADWMIDWPRWDFMDAWRDVGNWGLVTRRQMLPNKPCNFTWVADGLVLDGVLRSDNRGNEYLFPIYRREPVATRPFTVPRDGENGAIEQAPQSPADDPRDGSRGRRRVANFAAAHVRSISRRLRLEWVSEGSGDLHASWGPEDAGHYLYALLHAGAYQQAYASALREGFPPVVFPRDRLLLARLARLGRQLAECHRRRPTYSFTASDSPSTAGCRIAAAPSPTDEDRIIAPRYPRHEQGKVWINRQRWIAEIDRETWEFRAGAT